MSWEKLGHVFQINEQDEFLKTHASNPLPVHLDGDIYRVFYSGRDAYNKSSVGYVDIDIVLRKVVKDKNGHIFKYGLPDSFYSHGVSIGNLYESNNEKFILFMGWNIRNDEHWRGDIGRLRVLNNQHLEITPSIPFMTTDSADPISLSYPFVFFHEGVYKMWYGSTLSWTSENGEMIHVINYATSLDGENWIKHGLAIPYELGVAQAFSRPTVIINEEGYHMWYSYRSGSGEKYRIGYSHSDDGEIWFRKHNEVGLDVSIKGWDSEMICYPFVFEHKGERYMLYNGNQYGKEGFGLAKWKKMNKLCI
jgi:hypothetical protein